MMYLVTYDLQSGLYDAVEESIKSFGTYCKVQQTVWIIKSDASAAEVRDDIKSALGKGDKLFVISCAKGWASSGTYSDKVLEWLKKNV